MTSIGSNDSPTSTSSSSASTEGQGQGRGSMSLSQQRRSRELEDRLRTIFQERRGILDPTAVEAARLITLELVQLRASGPQLDLSTDTENDDEEEKGSEGEEGDGEDSEGGRPLRFEFRDANVAPLEAEVVSPLYWQSPPPQLSPPKASARKVPLTFPAVTARSVSAADVPIASVAVTTTVKPAMTMCYAPVMVEGGRPHPAY